MKELVELIGERNGYSRIDIHNCWDIINNAIEYMAKGQITIPTNEVILMGIKWGTSLKLRMNYKTLDNFITGTIVA